MFCNVWYVKVNVVDEVPPWWTVNTLFSPLFGHFHLRSENELESIDVLLYTSTVKYKGSVGNIPGGVWYCFVEHGKRLKNMFT